MQDTTGIFDFLRMHIVFTLKDHESWHVLLQSNTGKKSTLSSAQCFTRRSKPKHRMHVATITCRESLSSPAWAVWKHASKEPPWAALEAEPWPDIACCSAWADLRPEAVSSLPGPRPAGLLGGFLLLAAFFLELPAYDWMKRSNRKREWSVREQTKMLNPNHAKAHATATKICAGLSRTSQYHGSSLCILDFVKRVLAKVQHIC